MPRKQEYAYQTEGDVFASRLREVMEKRGENQTTLAAKITNQSGVIQRQSISQYMQGQSKPDTVRLTGICKALNVSSDYLLGLADHETPDVDLRKACEYIGLSEDAVMTLRQYLAFESNDLPNQIIGAKCFGEYIKAFDRLQWLNNKIINCVERARAYIQAGKQKEIEADVFDRNSIESETDIAMYKLRKAHWNLINEIVPIETTTKEQVRQCEKSIMDALWQEEEN